MKKQTELLIIGAGPFGLSVAAQAKHLGIDFVMLGKPMDFWRSNMPRGMFLRSGGDWHLDPLGVDTMERYWQTRGVAPEEQKPLSLESYLGYVTWFQKQKQLQAVPRFVERLDCDDSQGHSFAVALDDGQTLRAKRVVVALGVGYFQHVPEELAALFPPGRYAHTCDLVKFEQLREKRCLIIGGRQSAFEWAALLHEAGAAAVDICHRHPSPAFQEADWSWVNPLVDAMVDDPGWFRRLPSEDKKAVSRRLWAEGRLKVEPWLEPRLRHESIRLRPNTQVVASDLTATGELRVRLDSGDAFTVDHVILATGYKVEIGRVLFLARGNVLSRLETQKGFPVLDEHFQANIPGLFFTSMLAARDFGPFFAFTVSVRTSARLIGQALQAERSYWRKQAAARAELR